MSGPDPAPAAPRRRPSRLAAAVVGCLLVATLAGITVTLMRVRGGGTTAQVALITARAQGSADIAVEGVRLLGGPAGDLGVSRTSAPAAPSEADLGVVRVAAGDYSGVAATVGGETLEADVRTTLRDGALVPLLLVVAPHQLRVYWGNAAVNQGLLLAAGRLPQAPDVVFTDQAGHSVPWSSLRGRVVVAASLDTGCSDTCPLYTAVLQDLQRVLGARGWQNRVVIADISMDPQRDTPAELTAYAQRFGASWELLAADAPSTEQFWSALHFSYLKLPATPGQIDWYTGQPALYHLHHDSAALVFDADGYLRADVQGTPRLGHALTPVLAALLGAGSSQAEQEKVASWSVTDLLDRIDAVLGEPAEADRGVEQAARVGVHAPGFSLPGLDGGTVTLKDQVGHPVVVNFFATWCQPCRQELPLLAGAAARHPDIGVLALDEGEAAGDVRGFLADVLGAQRTQVVPLLDGDRSIGGDYAAAGLPVTVFVDSDGVVRATHVGQLDATSLQQGLDAISA